MYLSRFLQDYVSVYLPQDGQWNLMADCIEFDIKPYYQEEEYPAQQVFHHI